MVPMRRRILTPLAVLLLVLAVGAPAAPARTTGSDLGQALGRRLDRAKLRDGRYGVAVLTRHVAPKVVFGRGHTRDLRPASVAKVLTAATALDLLGPAHEFTTTVTARGELTADGILRGDLVVHGTGDPNLSGRFYDGRPTYVLERFAKEVRKAGIRRVTGALVLDDGPFGRSYFHPSWSERDRGRWYGAPVAGLAFNDGCADIVVKGAACTGGRATVVSPSTVGDWRLENKVKTVASGNPTVGGLWIRGNSTLRVQGTIAKGSEYPFSHPVPNPLRFFGGAFLQALDSSGVRVEGGTRAATDASDRRPGSMLLAGHRSPLGPTLRVMNRRSQNFYASLLFKATGATHEGWGTWTSGEHAVTEMLRRRGIDPEGETHIVDGSGLSGENRTTAATVVRLLHSFDQDLLRGPILYDSLAVPGQEGTMRRRLKSGDLPDRLHAKTGTLGRSGVHALAGYVDGKDGHPGYVFAILLDGVPGGRSLIDDLVREIAKR